MQQNCCRGIFANYPVFKIMSTDSEKDFLAGLAVGAILGGTLALVLGSDEGKFIRRKLKARGLKILSEISDLKDDVEDAVVDEARNLLPGAVKRVKTRISKDSKS